MKVKASEIKVGDQLSHPDIPEQKLIVTARDEGLIALAREGRFDLVPSRYYEHEFNEIGFERLK
jgi:hypothetical protein